MTTGQSLGIDFPHFFYPFSFDVLKVNFFNFNKTECTDDYTALAIDVFVQL